MLGFKRRGGAPIDGHLNRCSKTVGLLKCTAVISSQKAPLLVLRLFYENCKIAWQPDCLRSPRQNQLATSAERSKNLPQLNRRPNHSALFFYLPSLGKKADKLLLSSFQGTTFTGLGIPGRVTTYTFVVRATDPAGNVSPNMSTSYNFTVNLAPPKLAVASAPGPLTNQTRVAFTLTASDFGGAKSCADCDFQCKLDNATWQSCVPMRGSGPRITSGGGDATLSKIGGGTGSVLGSRQRVARMQRRLLSDSADLGLAFSTAEFSTQQSQTSVTVPPSPIAQYYAWLLSLSASHSNTVEGSLFRPSFPPDETTGSTNPPPSSLGQQTVAQLQGTADANPSPPPPLSTSNGPSPASPLATFDNSTGSLVLVLPALSPGPHTLLINATDNLQNSNITALHWAVEVDPPQGTLWVPDAVNGTPFSVELAFDKACIFSSSVESGTGFLTSWKDWFAITSGAELVGVRAGNASTAYTLQVRAISDGLITLALRQDSCFDGAGNGNAPITGAFFVTFIDC